MNHSIVTSFATAFAMIGIFMGLNFIMNRKFCRCLGNALRESVFWGGFFVICAGLSYLVIFSDASYSLIGS